MRIRRSRLALGLVLSLSLAPHALADEAEPPSAAIEYPAEGEAIGGTDGLGFVSARIRSGPGIDLMLVVDVSESTRNAAGDVDGDGQVVDPRRRSLGSLFRVVPASTSDTVFAAELIGAEALLSRLDPRVTRVGLIHFSGDLETSTPDAVVEVPLTYDYGRVRQALGALRERGPGGRSNLLAGIELATVELGATEGALSEQRAGALRTAYLFTDGNPTLPLPDATHRNRRLAIAAAAKARERGVSFHTYGFGSPGDPSMFQIGEVTEGSYVKIEDASRLAQRDLHTLSLVQLEQVEIENRTTGARASAIDVRLDGSVFALVPMQLGPNQLALAAQVGERKLEVVREVRLESAGPVDPPDPAQVEARERLLAAGR